MRVNHVVRDVGQALPTACTRAWCFTLLPCRRTCTKVWSATTCALVNTPIPIVGPGRILLATS